MSENSLARDSLERLVNGLKLRHERQVKALSDTKLQLDGAQKMLDEVKAAEKQRDLEAAIAESKEKKK